MGPVLCRILGSLNFLAGGESGIEDIRPDVARRILVIRPGGMGDMIILLPVIKALRERFPDAIIDIVCEKRNLDILKIGGLEESAIAYDSNPLLFLRRLRRRKYDVVVDTEQFHHFSAVFALISRAPVRIGFKINPRRNPLYTHLVNYALDEPESEQFMKLLEPLDIKGAGYNLEGAFSSANIQIPPLSGPFAVVHPGGSTIYKLWETGKFIELVKSLHELHGLSVVFVGGRNDRKVTNRILDGVKQAGCRTVSYTGKLSIAMTAGVMRQAELFIGSDSGLAHLATGLGLPTVVLFGPSDHLKWGVADARHAVVRRNLSCSPCFIFGYHKPCRTIACMRQISVKDVLEAVEKVISPLYHPC